MLKIFIWGFELILLGVDLSLKFLVLVFLLFISVVIGIFHNCFMLKVGADLMESFSQCLLLTHS